jgi:hypothetical protein
MRRRLDSFEAAFHAARRRLPTNCVIAARLSAAPDERALTAALDALQARHPLLRARVVEAEVPRFTDEDVPALPLRLVAGADAPAVLAEVEREMNRPFAAHAGPLARFVLLRGERDAALLVAFSHLIGDAGSALVMFRDLFAALRDPDRGLAPLPPRPGLAELLTNRGGLPGARLLGAALDHAADAVLLARAHLPAPPERAAEPQHIKVAAHALPGATTRALVGRCRHERCTVAGALGALLLQASARARRPDGTARIGCPTSIDLRDLLGPGAADHVGLQAHAPTLVYAVDPREPPWELARRVSARIRLARRWFAPSLAGLTMRAVRPWLPALADSPLADALLDASVVMSNVGQIPAIAGTDAIEVRDLTMFALVPGVDLVQVSQTYGERLTLNFIHAVPEARRGLADAVARDVPARLAALTPAPEDR